MEAVNKMYHKVKKISKKIKKMLDTYMFLVLYLGVKKRK